MPTVIPWAKDLDLRRLGAGPPSTSSTAAITPSRLVLGGRRQLRGVDPLAVDEDGVGEGPAHVDAEQHRGPSRLSARPRGRVSPSGPSDEVGAVELGVEAGEVGAQVAAAGLARGARAQVAIAAASG